MTETEPCVLKMGHTCCIIRWVGREREREQERRTEMQGDRVRERERESEWGYCEICWHRVQEIFSSQLRSWETPVYRVTW